jgi:hypothetical protein
MQDMSEAVAKIKSAGVSKVRSVPMLGSSALDGPYQVEVLVNGSWLPVIGGVSKIIADGLIAQAMSNVLLG